MGAIVVAFDGHGEALAELLPRAEQAKRDQAKDGARPADLAERARDAASRIHCPTPIMNGIFHQPLRG